MCVHFKMALFYHPLFRQIFIMVSVMFETLLCGFIIGFPAILLPALSHSDTEIVLNQDSASNIVAIRGIGYMVALLSIHVIMHVKGRKFTQIICVIPGFFGWTLCYFAQTPSHLMAMNALLGLNLGAAVSTVAMIVGEYSSPRYRGIFLIIKTGFVAAGITLVHTLGAYVYWRTVVLIALLPNVMSILLALFWPESPYWLASVGRYEECVTTFYWIRGHDEESQHELDMLLKKHTRRLSMESSEGVMITAVKKNLMYLKETTFWKPVFVVIVLNVLIEFSGRFVLTTYSVSIIESMTNDENLGYIITIFIDVVSLIATFIATVLVKYSTRRTLLFNFTYISIASLLTCSLVLFLKSWDVIPQYYMWLAVGLYVTYLSALNIGPIPLVIGIFGEIFPQNYKAVAGMVCGMFAIIGNTSLNKAMPYIMSALGPAGTFVSFAMIMTVCTVVLYKTLPETKDVPLVEIEKFWLREPRRDESSAGDKLLQQYHRKRAISTA